MAFEATKREWSELYAFFRLLADGYVYSGTSDIKKNEAICWPVAMVQREEHDGTRRYVIEGENIPAFLCCLHRESRAYVAKIPKTYGNNKEKIRQAKKNRNYRIR